MFICPVYAGVRHKYLREFTDNDVEPSLNSVFENPSIDAIEAQRRNAGFVTLYLFATVKQWDIGIMLAIQHPVRM